MKLRHCAGDAGGVKRKRDGTQSAGSTADADVAAGAARARAFLADFAALPLMTMPRAEALDALAGMRAALETDAAGNAYLREVLGAA